MSDTMKNLANVGMDGEVVFDATKAPAPAPVPVVRGVTVDAEGAARATADEKAAREAGFAVRPPLYTIGTMVVDLGVENFRASRQEFESKPTAREACASLAQRVVAEDRKDHVVAARDLTMLPDGRLQGPLNGQPVYPLSQRALEGLCTFTTPGGGGYLAECPPELRATNMNHWLPRALRLDKRATDRAVAEWLKAKEVAERYGTTFNAPEPKPILVPREVTVRTRKAGDSREIFAVTGPRYGAYDIDKIAAQVAAGVPDDARCDIIYDGHRARINVLFHSNIQPENAVAGEIFRAGLLITTDDSGAGSIKISAEVERNLCLNLIIIDFKQLLVGSRRHIGTTGNIAQDVKNHIEAAMNKIGYFVQKWSEANAENVLERYGLEDMEQVFEGLVRNKVVHVPGYRPEEQVKRLLAAWNKEPMRTKAGVLNAITRAAHEQTWRTWATAEELERKAGELLFAKEWKVELPREESIADLM